MCLLENRVYVNHSGRFVWVQTNDDAASIAGSVGFEGMFSGFSSSNVRVEASFSSFVCSN